MIVRNESGNTAYDGYGQIRHTLWRSKIFLSLTEDERLGLIYLIAGPEFSVSGIFTVDPVSVGGAVFRMEKSLNVKNSGLNVINSLQDAGILEYEEPVCWVKGVREYYSSLGDNQINVQIDADVAKIAPCAILRAYKAFYGLGDVPVGVDYEPMVLAVCEVTKIPRLLISRENIVTCRNIQDSGFSAKFILDVYGDGGKWYTSHWKGAKNPPQLPTVKDIKETIGWLPTAPEVTRSIGVDKEGLIKLVTVLLRSGAEYKEARDKIANAFGPDVWEKLVARGGWSAVWSKMTEKSISDKITFEVFK